MAAAVLGFRLAVVPSGGPEENIYVTTRAYWIIDCRPLIAGSRSEQGKW
jgi:hypothetical protein